MKVIATNPATAHGLIDPDTKRTPLVDPATNLPFPGGAEVPENKFWVRRELAGEIKRVVEPTAPEPEAEPHLAPTVAPLTTRGKE